VRNHADFECAVIGAGPGGLVSALYLKRFRRRVIIINAGVPRAEWIPKTHNLLGYADGISGRALLQRIRRQVKDLRVPMESGTARVTRARDGFRLSIDGRELTAKKVILATGIEDLEPPLVNIARLRLDGYLRYCPVCDAFEYRGKKLCAFVRNAEGIERATFLLHYTNFLTVVVSPDPQGFVLTQSRITRLRKLGVRLIEGDVSEIEPTRSRNGIWIRAGETSPIFAHAGYVELGVRVRDEAIRGLHGVRRAESGHLCPTSEQRLKIPGLFAVGDCVNRLGQISVAAGQAAIAATAVHNDLAGEE